MDESELYETLFGSDIEELESTVDLRYWHESEILPVPEDFDETGDWL